MDRQIDRCLNNHHGILQDIDHLRPVWGLYEVLLEENRQTEWSTNKALEVWLSQERFEGKCINRHFDKKTQLQDIYLLEDAETSIEQLH